uniref:(northern house mosquito) hypothetical protein n=1 Tax=Culex pipiens TaxID=7175 RepID=A0A8D8ISM7_CULPI
MLLGEHRKSYILGEANLSSTFRVFLITQVPVPKKSPLTARSVLRTSRDHVRVFPEQQFCTASDPVQIYILFTCDPFFCHRLRLCPRRLIWGFPRYRRRAFHETISRLETGLTEKEIQLVCRAFRGEFKPEIAEFSS